MVAAQFDLMLSGQLFKDKKINVCHIEDHNIIVTLAVSCKVNNVSADIVVKDSFAKHCAN